MSMANPLEVTVVEIVKNWKPKVSIAKKISCSPKRGFGGSSLTG